MGIVWWEVESPDPERFQAFCSALLGWGFEPAFADTALGADYWLVLEDGTGIGGLQRQAPGAPAPVAGTRVYALVDDLEAVLESAVTLGGVVERGRTALGDDDRWFATVREPSGISLGLWTPHAA